jgi:ribosomal protection tetracycline resistance protein
LTELAEQDPLINVRTAGSEIAVSLYGEVQKEVIEATLAEEYGLRVGFRETTTICIDRSWGPVVAGHRLPGDADPHRIPSAAVTRARSLRQVDV